MIETTLNRRERERRNRRRAMLQAAQAVFAEKGFSRATLDEIAHRAEFGKGTLYNYFEGGKEELLFAIFDDMNDNFIEVINSSLSVWQTGETTFRETIKQFIAACFSFFNKNRDQFMVSMKEAHRLIFGEERDKAAFFHQQQERIVDTLASQLSAAMEAGKMRTFDSRSVAHMLLGNIKGLYMHLCMYEEYSNCECSSPISAEDAAEYITSIMFDGLLPRDETKPSSQPEQTKIHC